MTSPKIETLGDKVDNRYTLCILAAKRARQITAYRSQLGQGVREFVPPQEGGLNEDTKDLTVALREIAAGHFSYVRPPEVESRVK